MSAILPVSSPASPQQAFMADPADEGHNRNVRSGPQDDPQAMCPKGAEQGLYRLRKNTGAIPTPSSIEISHRATAEIQDCCKSSRTALCLPTPRPPRRPSVTAADVALPLEAARFLARRNSHHKALPTTRFCLFANAGSR